MRKWVGQDRLVLLGIAQEQQAAPCRLFAQWKRLDFPILHDPINLTGVRGVPVVVAIDQSGVVRAVGGKPRALEKDFITRKFPAPLKKVKARPARRPDLEKLRLAAARQPETTSAWRRYGDALVLWKAERIDLAIEAYSKAIALDPRDAVSLFRLGVCHRMRHESPARRADDAEIAGQFWRRAAEMDPRQYIWRRRIQQYGPRFARPHPFYDWMPRAREELRAKRSSGANSGRSSSTGSK